tara:strand:- start:74 stop:415 length:342 start_codon:yes stop_codon:yes gene_type:complete
MLKTRLIPLLCLLILSLPFANAQTDHNNLEIDFGQVSPGEIVKKTLNLERKIKNIIVTCECVDAFLKDSQETETSIVEIQFDSTGYEGQVNQDIMFMDEAEELITVKVSAFVK